MNTLFIEDDDSSLRDEVLQALNAAGMSSRPPWTPMHELTVYRDAPRMTLEVTQRIAQLAINLPNGSNLTAH